MPNEGIEVYVHDGAVHIRVDRDGERAVSAIVDDVDALCDGLSEAAYDVEQAGKETGDPEPQEDPNA